MKLIRPLILAAALLLVCGLRSEFARAQFLPLLCQQNPNIACNKDTGPADTNTGYKFWQGYGYTNYNFGQLFNMFGSGSHLATAGSATFSDILSLWMTCSSSPSTEVLYANGSCGTILSTLPAFTGPVSTSAGSTATLLDLTTGGITGPLPIGKGGTGAATLATAGIPVISPTPSAGHCVEWLSATQLEDAGFACSPGTGTVTAFAFTNGNGFNGTVGTASSTPTLSLQPAFTGIAYSNGSVLAAAIGSNFPTLNQSTTGNAGTASALAVTPTQCSGIQLAAGIQASGNANCSGLPNPSAVTLGGIESFANVSHQWISAISTSGVPTSSQPAAADLSNGVTGSGAVVLATAPTLGLVNGTGLPLSTGVTGTLQAAQEPAHTGDATNSAGSLALSVIKVNGGAVPASSAALASNSSNQIVAATTTGSGSVVQATSPTLVSPALGTPSNINLANATGLPTTALPALTGVVTTTAGSAATSFASSTGTGAVVLSNSPSLTSPTLTGAALGTPASGVLTNTTGLPLSTGVTGTLQAAQEPAHTGDVTNTAGSLATSVVKVNGAALPASAAVLATNSSGQITAVTATGTGNAVLATSPTLTTPSLGTPSAINLANATNLPESGLQSITSGTVLGNFTGSSAAPTALTLPMLNLQQMGACGITDATTIFNAAATIAASTGQAIYIPNNCTVNHSGTLTLNGLQLFGDGIGSVLKSTDTAGTDPHSALYIQGNGVRVSGINFKSANAAPRSAQVYACAVCIPFGISATLTNFELDHLWFTSVFAGPDIQFDYAGTNGSVHDNWLVSGSLSNPIIAQAPFSHVAFYANHILAGGDNGIELVDYLNQSFSSTTDISVTDNDIQNVTGSCLAFLGAARISSAHNHCINPGQRGLYIASENTSTESVVSDISSTDDEITGAGASDGYIFVWGSTVTNTVTGVNIIGPKINMTSTAPLAGIFIGSCDACASPSVFNVTVSKAIIRGDGTHGAYGINLRSALKDITLEGNQINTVLGFAIEVVNSSNDAGTLKINGNTVGNLTLTGANGHSAIDINNPGFIAAEVYNNSYTQGTFSVSHFVTCGSSYTLSQGGNIGTQTDFSGCTIANAGATSSIGGSALTAGQCSSGTVSIANSTTGETVSASPVTYPGDGAWWEGYVSTAGTVTVKVCASVSMTPTTSVYNVRVHQ